MTSDPVLVDPVSVKSYGSSAQEIFEVIRGDLEGLVSDAVSVEYKGENAVQLKTGCATLAADFGTAVTADLRGIADSVQSSTTGIVQALGGSPVIIEFDGGTVNVPAIPQGDGTYSADPAGLEALKGEVKARFASVAEQFSVHLSKLTSTVWTGAAKDRVVQEVSMFTSNAQEKIEQAGSAITNVIEQQLEALRAADS